MRPGSPLVRADRWRRRCGFDANDLRRDLDRTQWRFGLVLLALFIAVTPPVTVHTARAVHDSGLRYERQEAAAWRQVDTVVTGTEAVRGGHRVTVTWHDPDGTRRTGDLATWSDVGVGDRLPAWTGHGVVAVMPPHWQDRTVVYTVAAGAGAVLAVGLPLLGLYGLVRRRFDRRRDQLWDAAWARLDTPRIGP